MLQKILKKLIKNTYTNILVSLGLLIILGFIDRITGYELSFQFFYFIPLSVFSYNLVYNKWSIFSFAILTTLVWFTADVMAEHQYSSLFLYFWNTLSRGVVFCSFSLFLNSIIKQRSRILKLNQQLIKRENSINESINYARTIQNSLIHTNQNVNDFFKDFFVIDSPKNILSGDYYWYYDTKKHTFIALVDCTGHGIPGSILSVISNLLLKKIIIEREISAPDEILSELHIDIINALSADKETNEDGMEISIVRYDKENNEVCYSQTTQSILVFDKDNSYIMPESNGYTIGSYLSIRNGNKYSSDKIKLKKDSWIYMFTDGMIDQFNPANNEKYSFERLIKFIKNNNHQSGEYKSEAFINEINKWKGDNINTDDITVLGFKFF